MCQVEMSGLGGWKLEGECKIDLSVRGRARADIQGRGDDGAGSGESIGEQPSGGGVGVGPGGLCLEQAGLSLVKSQRSGGLGPEDAMDRRALLARRTESPLLNP